MVTSTIVSDSRPGRLQLLLAASVAVIVLIAAVAGIPFGRLQLAEHPGFLPAFGGITSFADLCTVVLLLGQARVAQSRAAAQLAAAYAFSFLIVVPHLLSFPGVFAGAPLLGGPATTVWLWCAWHCGFGVCVACYALFGAGSGERFIRPRLSFVVVVAAVTAAVLATTYGLPWLPTILDGGKFDRLMHVGVGPAVIASNVVAFVLVAVRLRLRNTVALWLCVAMLAASAYVVLTLLSAGRFTLGWYLARVLSLLANVTVFMALLVQSMRLFGEVAKLNAELERLSMTDTLTRLPNRRAFEKALDAEWKRAAREQLPLSLLMIDLDYFKGYNDCLGHPAGDRCLRRIAETLGRLLQRPFDMAARLGGEEFMVLLPNAEAASAARMAERIRAAIEALQIDHPAAPRGIVTISLGVATGFPHGRAATLADMMDQADAALYEAKHGGRNCVRAAGQPVTPALVFRALVDLAA